MNFKKVKKLIPVPKIQDGFKVELENGKEETISYTRWVSRKYRGKWEKFRLLQLETGEQIGFSPDKIRIIDLRLNHY